MVDTPSEEWWVRARRARDRLDSELSGDPSVRLIDIGLPATGSTPVLRVHVSPGREVARGVPSEVEGIPVHVIPAEYTPES
jgi:hypothetical protein